MKAIPKITLKRFIKEIEKLDEESISSWGKIAKLRDKYHTQIKEFYPINVNQWRISSWHISRNLTMDVELTEIKRITRFNKIEINNG